MDQQPDRQYLNLYLDLSDQELRKTMHQLQQMTAKTGRGFEASIFGFDDDPRELCEIPEVRAFCQKLIKIGLIHYLVHSSLLGVPQTTGQLLGALEVWLLTNGKMQKDGVTITPKLREEFERDYSAAKDRSYFFLCNQN